MVPLLGAAEAAAEDVMMGSGRIEMYLVEPFDDWYWKSGDQNSKWLYRLQDAKAEVKLRLGVDRFQEDAHLRRRMSSAGVPIRDYDGYSWRCVWCEEYANCPRSNQQFDHCSGVRLLKMDSEAPRFKNPFARTE
jgi:hypothetical protein